MLLPKYYLHLNLPKGPGQVLDKVERMAFTELEEQLQASIKITTLLNEPVQVTIVLESYGFIRLIYIMYMHIVTGIVKR